MSRRLHLAPRHSATQTQFDDRATRAGGARKVAFDHLVEAANFRFA